MKHIFHSMVFLVIIAILLTACCKEADYSNTYSQESVTVDTSSSKLQDKEDFNVAKESSCVENSEDEIPKSFVELTPFDINEKEYRFLVGDTEYVIDLSHFDSTSTIKFDSFEDFEHKTDINYIEKRPITTAEESINYGMDIFKEYCMRIIGNKASKDEWLLLGVLRDEINDAWGICFAPAPLCPGPDLHITYYSDGEMISFGFFGE